MKARIEKKLSQRLVRLAPTMFRAAWVDSSEPSDLAKKQRTAVNHVYSIGGGTDAAGDGQDLITTWKWWKQNWKWQVRGPSSPSTITMLRLAVKAEATYKAEEARIKASRAKYLAPAQGA